MAFDFYQEIHRTRTFFQKLQQGDRLNTVFRSRSIKQSFSIVLVACLFKSGLSEVREIIFKSYRIVCRLGEVEALLHLPA